MTLLTLLRPQAAGTTQQAAAWQSSTVVRGRARPEWASSYRCVGGALRFTGTSSARVQFGALTTALANVSDGAWTFAFVIRRASNGAGLEGLGYLLSGTGNGVAEAGLSIAGNDALAVDVDAGVLGGPTVTGTTETYLVVVAKGAGTVAPAFSRYAKSTNTWTHATGGTTLADQAAASKLELGSWQTTTDFFDGWMGVAAVWEGAMSQTHREALSANWCTSDFWASAHGAPAFLVELNKAAASVTDLAGNASSLTSAGTTFDATEALGFFTFDGVGVAREASWVSSWVTRRRATTAWATSYVARGRVRPTWQSSYVARARVRPVWASSYVARRRGSGLWASSWATRARASAGWASGYLAIGHAVTSWHSRWTTTGRAAGAWTSGFAVRARAPGSWASSYAVVAGSAANITGRTATVSESASATTVTGTIPTGTVVGDFILAVFVTSTAPASFVAPAAGWTQLVVPTNTGGGQTFAVYYRIATGSDTAPTAGGTTAGRITCLMQSYSGVSDTTPLDVAAVVTQTSVGSPYVLTGLTTVTNGARLISAIASNWSTGTWTKPASMTLLATHTTVVGRAGALADEAFVTAGATGTRGWSDSAAANSAHVGAVFALRPGVTVPRTTATWQSSYVARGRARPSWQSAYIARGRVRPAWQASYVVRGRVRPAWATSYRARARVQPAWATSYIARHRASTAWASSYVARRRGQTTWGSSYATRDRLSAAWSTSYVVTVVGSTRTQVAWQTAYVVRRHATTGWTASFIVRRRAPVAWLTHYAVRGRASALWPSGYGTQTRGLATWGTTWTARAHRATVWVSSTVVRQRGAVAWSSSYAVNAHPTGLWTTSYVVTVPFVSADLNAGRAGAGILVVRRVTTQPVAARRKTTRLEVTHG